jgi:hypothetical protein
MQSELASIRRRAKINEKDETEYTFFGPMPDDIEDTPESRIAYAKYVMDNYKRKVELDSDRGWGPGDYMIMPGGISEMGVKYPAGIFVIGLLKGVRGKHGLNPI